MDYKDTLLLGKSNFEMRGNLNQKEPVLVKQWDEINLYKLMNDNRVNAPTFALHDGPPYANGDIHCGHMLNKLLKDFIVRYKNMAGFYTPFIPGWDTHGLPIENRVTKSGINRKTTPIAEFRKKCEEYALTQVEKQKEEFLRLGVLGDFSHPYITLQKEFEAKQIEIFADMALKGLIYKGLKPVYWSPSSESALAEAEIEYADVLSHSIYVAFKVKDGKGLLDNDCSLIIWTTTPWTMPANLAISAHPDFVYGLFETNKGKFVFLEEFKDKLSEELGFENVKLVKTFKGTELEYVVCKHPFYDRDSLVLVGTHVTNDAGTGLVHTAPGHGAEDYVVCQKYGIKAYCPVDGQGRLTPDTGDRLAGLYFEDANQVVLDILTEHNALLKHTTFTHSYPHDWRTGKPLIFRATDQWFCSISPIKEKLLNAIHDTKWYPAWGENRMVNMIKDRVDWCISRQRVWGVPIPIFYCEDKTPIIDKDVFQHVADLFREYGSNIWFEKEAKDLLPVGYKNEHSPNGKFTKEQDIMDVWFDSGSSFAGTMINRGLKYPVDLYLEGSDQYRGWFNSSLINSVAVYDKAPYQTVVSHGWVLDEHGEQMHKSKGNGVDPIKIANQYGSDILRLWVATVDYQQDVRIGENLIKQTAEQYRKIRNTLKFISSHVNEFKKPENVKYSNLDKFMLAKLEQVTNSVIKDFDNYNFLSAMSTIMTFMSRDISSFYLDVTKDTLYCDKQDDEGRIAVQSVLLDVAETLLRLLNPILPFTMDEFNKNLPGERKVSPQLLDSPKVSHNYDEKVLDDYECFISFRDDVLKALEVARSNALIGSAQEAIVEVEVTDKKVKDLLADFSEKELARYSNVSTFKFVNNLSGDTQNTCVTKVLHHDGIKCDRCRNYTSENVFTEEDGSHLCERCRKVLGK